MRELPSYRSNINDESTIDEEDGLSVNAGLEIEQDVAITVFVKARSRAEKWGSWILLVGYMLVILNTVALVLTTMNILGYISHTSPGSHTRSAYNDKLGSKDWKDLPEDQKKLEFEQE